MESSQSTDNQEQPKPLSHILKDLSQVRKDFEAGQISDVDFAKGVNTQAVSLRSYSENLNPITEAYIQRCLLESIRLVKSKKGDFQADMAAKNGLDNAIAMGLDKKDGAIGAYIKSLVKERDNELKTKEDPYKDRMDEISILLSFLGTKTEDEILSDPQSKDYIDRVIPRIICNIAQDDIEAALSVYLSFYPNIRKRELGLVVQALPENLRSEFSTRYVLSQRNGEGNKNTSSDSDKELKETLNREYQSWVESLRISEHMPFNGNDSSTFVSYLPYEQRKVLAKGAEDHFAKKKESEFQEQKWWEDKVNIVPGNYNRVLSTSSNGVQNPPSGEHRQSPSYSTIQTGWGRDFDTVLKASPNSNKVYIKRDPEEGLVRIGGKDGR